METSIRSHSAPSPDCFEDKPTSQSVLFGDVFVNLSGIARTTKIHHATLSRIFSGSRRPTLDQAVQLSRCLGLSSVDEFLLALSVHFKQIERRKLAKVKSTHTFVA